jgi:hypothetical protein
LVWPLAFAQSDPWAAAVLVDEFDAGGFECAPNDIEGRPTRLTNPRLKLMHSYDAYTSLAG